MKRLSIVLLALALVVSSSFAESRRGVSHAQSAGQQMKRSDVSTRLAGPSNQGLDSVEDIFNVLFTNSHPVDGFYNPMKVMGQYYFTTINGDGLSIYDLADPDTLALLGSALIDGYENGEYIEYWTVGDDHAYILTSDDSLEVFDVSNPESTQHLITMALPESPNAITYSDNKLCIASFGAFPDFIHQLYVYDVSNPASPVLADQFDVETYGLWNIYNNHLYIVGSSILYIFNITDPYNVAEATPFSLAATWGAPVFNDGMMYLVCQLDGESSYRIHVFDVSSPSSPVLVATFPRIIESTPMIEGLGDYVVVRYDESPGFYTDILDVTDIANGNYVQTGYHEKTIGANTRPFVAGDRLYDRIYLPNSQYQIEVLNFAAALGDSLTFVVANMDSSAFPVIEFDVTVLDSSGTGITGLATEDFELAEDDADLTSVVATHSGNGTYHVVMTADNDSFDAAVRQLDLFIATQHPFGGTSFSYTAPPPEVHVALDSQAASEFPIIYLQVTVSDESDNPVTGLTGSNFSVAEDEVDQPSLLMNELGDGSYGLFYYTTNSAYDETVRQVRIVVNHNTATDTVDTQYTAPGPELYLAVSAVDSSRFPTITNYLRVFNQVEDPFSGLTASDFDIEEDGVPHTVGSATETNTVGRAATSLMLNFRSSMTPEAIDQMRIGARTYVRNFAPGDTGLVGTYAGALGNVSNLTSDTTALMSIINSTHNGLTVGSYLIDDIQFAGSAVNFTAADKAVIIVADSADDGRSATSLSDLYTNLRAANVRVFPIGIGSMVDVEFMQDLADTSGGRYFQVNDPMALPGIFKQISAIMHSNYEVAYTTQNDASDGTRRAVHLVASYNSLSDEADTSYTAPNPPGITVGEVSVVAGDSAAVPVTVTSFTNVSVIELVINVDLEAISFGHLDSEVLGAPVYNAAANRLIVTWSSLTPLYLNDGDTLFTMHFDTDGLVPGESVPLTWSATDSSFIANNRARVFQGVDYQPGSVSALNIFDISGSLSYHANSINLEGVSVFLSGDTTLTATTDSDGNYSFADILVGSYVVSPSLSEDAATGVSTLDAYRIQTHVASIDPFPTGYHHLAADVDGGATINTTDAYKVQRVVVGLDDSFEAGDWLFVNSDYPISGENWTEAELERAITLVDADSVDQDFYGVRIGDANGTWPSRFLPGPSKDEDITGSLTIAEASVLPGGTVSVDLHAQGLSELGVIEWHLAFDPTVVTLQDVDLHELPGAMMASTDSSLSVSWYNISTPLNCDDRILASLTFEAVNENNVQSDLTFTRVVLGNDEGELLWTEEIGGSILVSDLAGVNGAEALVTDWALRPAYPNPFNAYTTLSFDLKETGNVRIQVYNILGDLVATVVDGHMAKGRYSSSINAQSWSSGTYFVVMKTRTFNKVQKIVLLK